MINKTEKEIMSNWLGPLDQPKVSVRCLAFNHEKYIEKALDSFLMQETNFSFEVIVHDDASTDNTASIIKEYATKYPHIVKPIFELENVYSKHDGSIWRIISSKAKGKYTALCEGDDYWIDNNKLQAQYDELEKNDDYYLCVHNTCVHDLSGKSADRPFNSLNVKRVLEAKEVIVGWNVHTSSFFFRSSLYDYFMTYPNINNYHFGDYILLCLALFHGNIIYLPSVMSVYNKNNVYGLTYSKEHSDLSVLIKKETDLNHFLKDYNTYTSNRYQDIVSDVICYHNLICEYLKGNCKEILSNKEYYKIFRTLPISFKMRVYTKRFFPKLFSLLKNKSN